MEYALNQIHTGGLSGNHHITLQVEGEANVRGYEVVWQSTDTTALTSKVTIFRW